ncbi:MAG: carbonic anhydrase [Geobacter sp.]|nr:carbonic anhydrase [Geobacter sp.]
MKLLDKILAANSTFVKPGAFPPLPKDPKQQFAIFTCMDTRLVEFLEPAMGIKRGDAKVIKNAGNTLVDPLHGGVIRSLVAAIFTLGSVDAVALKKRMVARGIPAATIDELVPDLAQWLGTFGCPEENVSDVVAKIRRNPLIPQDVPIHGLIFCPTDGHLDVIIDGYDNLRQETA